MASTTEQHKIQWVIPVETEPEVDWDCPCLDGVSCKEQVRAWYNCDRKLRAIKPGSRTETCNTELSNMSKCLQAEHKAKESEGETNNE